MFILTHRGLDPSRVGYFPESTIEAFLDHLTRGFGLEFDLQMTKDKKIVVSHDDNLSRISGGTDSRLISELGLSEIGGLEIGGCRLSSLRELLVIIDKYSDERLSAVHVKSEFQKKDFLDILLDDIDHIDPTKFIFFDLKPESADYLKSKNKLIQLAASVSHPYDIKRFNRYVGGTLISLDDIINYNNLFDWAWLDEWDRTDEIGSKSMYNSQNFSLLRDHGFKIALVTPELHRNSPGLLAKECHQDAGDIDKLFSRVGQILKFEPEAICTDYPDRLQSMVKELK